MAILEGVPGIKVTVRVNGADCTEYDDPNTPDQQPAHPTSSKYIESSDDAEFVICFEVDKNYIWGPKHHLLNVLVQLDSSWVTGQLVGKSNLAHGKCSHIFKSTDSFCQDTRSWFSQGFKFSAVRTIDDATKERIKKDLKVSDKLGLIRVTVERCVRVGPSHSKPTCQPSRTSFELAEKSLKGKSISHGTKFSARKPIAPPSYAQVKRLSEDDGPIAIFQFRYRSRKALQEELIIPPSTRASPTLDGLSQAEITRLAKERLDDIKADKKVKKEKGRATKREAGGFLDITADGPLARHSKKPRAPSEVIDLTGE